MDKETGLYVYRMKYYSALKKKKKAICDNTSVSEGHEAKQNKPDTKKNIA